MLMNSDRKNSLVITIIATTALVAASVSLFADPKPTAGDEARILRQALAAHPKDADLQQKAAILATLDTEASRLNTAKTLTPEARSTIETEKALSANEHAKEPAEVEGIAASEPNPFFGVHDAADVPSDFAADEFVPLTYWGGTLNGKSIGVFSGYRPSDPSHGVVVVMADKSDFRGVFYDAPGAPGRIEAVASGHVSIVSSSGRTAFDLAARHFETGTPRPR